MKQLPFLILVVCLLVSCKKIGQTQEQLAEDIIVRAMTDGQWQVTLYQDAQNRLPEFTGFVFQFKSNRTVDAVQNGTLIATGTWEGDGYKRQITAQYAAAAGSTLQRLNGIWQITNNNWTWVRATQTINGTPTTLELRKL